MGKVGAQDLWVVGSRFYFQRDPINSVIQPLIDLGRVETAQPTIEPTEIEIFDSDGGINKKLASQVTQIDESYELTCSNFSPDNLALLFLGEGVQEFTQSNEGEVGTLHWGTPDKLTKLVDSTGDGVYNLEKVVGVTTTAVGSGLLSTAVATAVDASAKTITVSSDITGDVSVNDKIVLSPLNLADPSNAATYTVTAIDATTITVSEDMAADESSIAGVVIYEASGDSGKILVEDTDYEVVSTDRGIIRMKTSSDFTDPSAIYVSWVCNAVSGQRLILPQTVQGEVAGNGYLIYGRGNNAEQTVREARMSVIPSGTNLSADDYSNFSLTVSVVSDLLQTGAGVAGRLLSYKGILPDPS